MSFNTFHRTNKADFDSLTAKFSSYPDFSGTTLENWFSNFEEEDYPLALKVLKNIDYFDNTRVLQCSRSIKQQLDALFDNNYEEVYFCGSGSAGHSSQIIVPTLKQVLGYSSRTYDSKFLYTSDVNKLKAGSKLVIIDDFIGTGTQMTDFVNEILGFLQDGVEIIVASSSGYSIGITKVQRDSPATVLVGQMLDESDKLINDKNQIFTSSEQEKIREYCTKTGLNDPLGFADCGGKVVFHYRTPNNTVSIIGAKNSNWHELFPRYLNNNV